MNETYGPPISHPFHIHINPFQIVEVFDPNATVNDPNLGTVPKYVFTTLPKAANVQPPSSLQCVVNLNDRSTWTDCKKDTSNNPRIWWDVFPIPSGKQVTVTNTQLISANTPLSPTLREPTMFRATSTSAAALSTSPASTCCTVTSWRTKTAA